MIKSTEVTLGEKIFRGTQNHRGRNFRVGIEVAIET